MTEQNRLVYGCYDSVDDVAAVIEELRSKQFTNSDMTLVTREDKVLAYSEKLGIPIQTEKDVLVSSSEKQIAQRTDPDYKTDDDPLYHYQEQVESGCIVLLVHGAKYQPNKEKEAVVEDHLAETIVDMTDAMQSNVITSTGRAEMLDSQISVDDD